MKFIKCFTLFLIVLCTGFFSIAKNANPYRIILQENASESERWAAKELQHWLYEISGEYLPLQVGSAAYTGNKIVLGYNEEVKIKTGKPAPDYKSEAYHYYTDNGNLYIYGGQERGTMYGVFSFLENEFGCRWYTPLVTVIPKKNKLVFGTYNYSSAPGITVRNDFYFEAFDPTWAARNKMNGRMDYVNQPGGVEGFWRVHTFYPLLSPAEFFEKHPEYFSLINGKRVYEVKKERHTELAQLCLSNKSVLKILTERLRQEIKKSPEYRIYDVSQNDYYNQCQCDKCQAIVKKYGEESGLMIWFVNQVAEAIEKEFPDKYIGTLAYQYTRKPPRDITPRKNVVVRLCPIEACFAHDLKSCELNTSFLDDMQKWAVISPQLYIWDYVVNFAHYSMPFPNFNVLQSNIKTFKENKSIGIMEQAAYQSRGAEFAELRAYLISRLLWNPDTNTQQVIEDFMYGFYGKGGRYILDYFNLTQNLVTPETHMKIWMNYKDPLFTETYIAQSFSLFEEALKVADNETVAARISLSSLPILYLHCMRSPVQAKRDGSYEKVLQIIAKEGVTLLAESAGSIERFKKHVEEAQ